MNAYKVVEDNGGGLSLFVFAGQNVVYSHSGYEHNPGHLSEDLKALDGGSDVSEWDGCDKHSQKTWDALFNFESRWNIVAEMVDGKRSLNVGYMGVAAKLEFGIK